MQQEAPLHACITYVPSASVQEAVHGPSLAATLRAGWQPDEAQVARIAIELLGTLRYPGSRRPPVVHRQWFSAFTPSFFAIEGPSVTRASRQQHSGNPLALQGCEA